MRLERIFAAMTTGAAMLLCAGSVAADELYGKCIGAGGNKCENHHRISTSWNGRTAHIDPSAGTYDLDFGDKVDASVTVYCDGRKVGTVYVRGRTNFTIDCR